MTAVSRRWLFVLAQIWQAVGVRYCRSSQPLAFAARLNIMSRVWPWVLIVGFTVLAAIAGCSSSPRCPPGASCPASVPRVTFIPTINGQTAVLSKDGHVPQYHVRSGASLIVRVTVTVPKHVKITALWFGISTGTWGNGPKGRPAGMNPILARFLQPLSAGSHTFQLRWHAPHRRPATSLYLTYTWSSIQPPATVAGPIATLMLS